MKRLLLVLVMMLVMSGTCLAQWEYVMTNDRGDYYIDKQNIKSYSHKYIDYTKAKIKIIPTKEFAQKNNIPSDIYLMDTYIINKDTKSYFLMMVEKYDQQDKQIYQYTFTEDFKPYDNNKIIEIILKEGK